MKTIKLTTQFKKDLKRYKHHQSTIEALEAVLGFLARGEQLPPHYRPHLLTGNYRGHMECHVENDSLLIWYDADTDTVTLVRFGSHSELF